MRQLLALLLFASAAQGGQIIRGGHTAAAPAPTPYLIQQATATCASGDCTVTMGANFLDTSVIVVTIANLDADGVRGVYYDSNYGADGFLLTVSAENIIYSIVTNIYTNVTFNYGGHNTVLVRPNGSSGRVSVNVTEWGSVDGDGDATYDVSSSTTVNTNSVTPASTRNLVIAAGGFASNFYSSGPTGGFTRLTAIGGSGVYLETAYKIQTSATAATATWKLSSSADWAGAIEAFAAP